MHEKRYRGLVKAVSWRIMGTCDTFAISFLVTGKLPFALSISFFEVFTKITLFYIHERMWNRIKLGRVHNKTIDYEI